MSEQRRKLAEQIVEFYKLAPHYKDKSSYGTIPRDREQQAYIDAAYGTPHEHYLRNGASGGAITPEAYRGAFESSNYNPVAALGLDGSRMRGGQDLVKPFRALGMYTPGRDEMLFDSKHGDADTITHEAQHRGLMRGLGIGFGANERQHNIMTAIEDRLHSEQDKRRNTITPFAIETLGYNHRKMFPPLAGDYDVARKAISDAQQLIAKRPMGPR